MAITERDAEINQIKVDFLSQDDARRVVEDTLRDLGLTFEELRQQAADRSFSSDLAQRTWLAIHSFVEAE
jgi:hypothetical protein